MSNFKFNLGDSVYIRLGNLQGTITARSEYLKTYPNLYQLYYLDSTGDPVHSWFDEDDLIQ